MTSRVYAFPSKTAKTEQEAILTSSHKNNSPVEENIMTGSGIEPGQYRKT